MMGAWPRRAAVAMEGRRWVPETLRKGTNSASWLVGCGVKEWEECML